MAWYTKELEKAILKINELGGQREAGQGMTLVAKQTRAERATPTDREGWKVVREKRHSSTAAVSQRQPGEERESGGSASITGETGEPAPRGEVTSERDEIMHDLGSSTNGNP